MILLSLDFETTGLNTTTDRAIEIGAVLYSTGQKKCLESVGKLVQTDLLITAEVTKLTNIHASALERFGFDSFEAWDDVRRMMKECDYVVAHNGNKFDRPIYETWCRLLKQPPYDRPWIDTMYDIPGVEPMKLKHLAAEHGIIMLFPHTALSDSQTVVKILEQHDINKVVERAKVPTQVVVAHHDRSQNRLARKAKFRWNPDHKIWWKAMKETDIEAFAANLAFDVSIASKEITLESLQDESD